MDETQRELATNRLLDIIRSGRTPRPQPEAGEAETAPTEAVAPEAPPAAPSVQEVEPGGEAAAEPGEKTPGAKLSRLRLGRRKAGEADEADAVAALRPGLLRVLDSLRKPKAKKPTGNGKPKVRLSLKGRARRTIALDIGSAAIKLVEAAPEDGGFVITRAEVNTIPIAVRRNQSGYRMYVANAVRELLPAKVTEKANLHILLPDQAMQIRTVALPAVSSKERLNAIKFQLKKDLPFPLEVCEVTYRGWDPKRKERQDIEVLAVDRRVMTQRLELLTEAGLTPIHLTAFPSAAISLISHYRDIEPEKQAVALVDIGAGKTTITILDQKQIYLTRTIATGGEDFTAVLQGLGLGPDGDDLNEVQAERHKIEVGMPPEGDTATMRISILMRPVAERISAEITRSLDFYRRHSGGAEIQKLILIGGGSQMKRLANFLARNLGVEVETGDFRKRIEVAAEVSDETHDALALHGPALLPAIAVALDRERRQNILPPDLKTFHKLKEAKKIIAPVAVALLLLLMGLYSSEVKELRHSEQQVKALKAQLTGLNQSRTRYLVAKAEHDKLAAELAGRQQDFNEIRIEDPRITDYIRALSHLTPDNIYLESLKTRFIPEVEVEESPAKRGDEEVEPVKTVESILADAASRPGGIISIRRPVYGRVLELRGDVYPLGTLTDVQLVDYVFSLEKSGYFRDVAVDTVAAQESGKIWFTIICGI